MSGAQLTRALAWRYLTGRGSRLMSTTARAALFSTGLGVTAMVIAMALMNGYTRDLESKLLSSGAIVVYPQLRLSADSLNEAGELLELHKETVALVPGVASVTHTSFGQGTLSFQRGAAIDVLLRGVDPDSGTFGASREQLEERDGVAGVVLGQDLAARLGVAEGDRVKLTAVGLTERGPRFRFRGLEVRGFFSTGFSEYDRSYVVLERELVQSVGGPPGMFEVAVAQDVAVDTVIERLERTLGDDFLVTDWRQHNLDLTTVLRLQKLALFLVLGLIVFVSAFNVASTLVVLVRERLREIGTLAALGLTPRRIRQLFVWCGLLLGTTGALLGVAVGATISWLLTYFRVVRFGADVAEIYFIRFVPFRVAFADVAAVIGFTLAVVFVASWLPALRATRLSPSAALRQE